MSAMNSMSNVENLSPQIIRRVVKEMNDLVNEPPEGIKVNINDEDITDIQAYIEGPAGTPYAGGIFRVKLALGKDFPQTPPKAFFLTKIFHPNVAKNGEICVNTLKKDWKPDLGIKHILLTGVHTQNIKQAWREVRAKVACCGGRKHHYSGYLAELYFKKAFPDHQDRFHNFSKTVKCLLIVPNAESALNEEAGKLLLEQYECYSQRARMMTEIHALSQVPKAGLEAAATSTDGPMAKKHAGDKKMAAEKEKKKLLKDKKRTLKRL